MLFSRKLLRPHKHGKLGKSSSLQITHSEDCRSICYKSSSLGKSRKHNFHKTLLNEENHPGLFFARHCTPPGALCDLSCLESKWNGVSQRDSNGYFSKKEKLNFTMEILCLPWPLQQLTGTQEELTSSEDWFILADLWRVSSQFLTEVSPLLQKTKPKQIPASPQLVTCSFSIAHSTLLFPLTKTDLGLVTSLETFLGCSQDGQCMKSRQHFTSGNPGGAGSRKGERKGKREEDYQAQNHLSFACGYYLFS